MKKLFPLLLLSILKTVSATPESDMEKELPRLFQLTKDYAEYVEPMRAYANRQGFRAPYEQLAVTLHELSHLASAAHQGYFIDGTYYEPYIAPEHWPSLRNRDILPLLLAGERGPISSIYMPATPENNLGNILDEVNAYTHGMAFICRHEPQSAKRQATNLLGHLNVVEAYLRTARTRLPNEYQALLKNRYSAGAIKTITERAWVALATCGLAQSSLPNREAMVFVGALENTRSGK